VINPFSAMLKSSSWSTASAMIQLSSFPHDEASKKSCLIFSIHRQLEQDFQAFLLSSLKCSQIWLSPLVDDSQTTYLTKLEKKKPIVSQIY
jgi:hypothetical protein